MIKVYSSRKRFQFPNVSSQTFFISVKNCQFCKLETVHTPKSKTPKQQSETKETGEKSGQVQMTNFSYH